MNAPTTFTPPTELTREQRADILEVLADLGEFEHEFEQAQCLRLAAEHGDQRAWTVNKRIDLEVSAAEFDFLLPFVDETGARPLDLVKVDDVRQADVRRESGQWQPVRVQTNEHVTLKVLSLTMGGEERRALIQIEGAGEYAG